MSATKTVSPPAWTEADIESVIDTAREHDDETLLYLLAMSIEHMQELALEAGWGGIYNTGSCARVALCELSLRGVTLSADMLQEALDRMSDGGAS